MTIRNRIFVSILYLLALAEILYAGYVFYYGYLSQDHAEHLHASWLVWQGEVPYRDFFEHHNPLLWYVLAPLMPLFYQNAIILYVAKIISAVVYAIMFWGFYRLQKDFLELNKFAFGLSLMLFFLVKPFLFIFYELNPDSFMYCSFVWGLWWYFKFLKTKEQKSLNISFILFTVSFLFLQKILVMLGGLGAYTIYLMIKKEVNLNAVFKATVVPICVILTFLFYLYYTQSLLLYFLFNYELNWIMQKFMGVIRINEDISIAYVMPCLAMLSTHHFLKSRNRYRNIFAGIVFMDYIIKMVTWAPWVQYFIFTHFACLLIVMETLCSLKRRKIAITLSLLLFIGTIFGFLTQPMNMTYQRYFYTHRYIMQNSRKDEPIINGTWHFFNIYGKNPSYYWFGYQNIAPIAYYLYGYDKEPDVNQMLYWQQPKFFYAYPYLNAIAFESLNKLNYEQYLKGIYDEVPNHGEGAEAFAKRWSDLLSYEIDTLFLKHYYQMTAYKPLMVRKDLAKKYR